MCSAATRAFNLFHGLDIDLVYAAGFHIHQTSEITEDNSDKVVRHTEALQGLVLWNKVRSSAEGKQDCEIICC